MPLDVLLAQFAGRLAPVSDTPGLDTQVLAAHILGQPRTWLLAHPEFEPDQTQLNQLEQAMQRLLAGQPLPYVLGHWEFYGRRFIVSPDVLIPRPETELLVEQALAWLRAHPGGRARVVDVGTGSGCIAVSLAADSPGLHVLALDISPAALDICAQNAAAQGVAERVHPIQSDLLAALDGQPIDLLCANLPYIPTVTMRNLAVYRREPTLALDGGPDGLGLIRRLLAQAAPRLQPGGLALFEIEATQGLAALALARQHFPACPVRLFNDLSGRQRLLAIQT